ncbi:MAG: hypothetical protein ACXAB4_09695, partial [Candidatus Hodarchaeales archaeon]
MESKLPLLLVILALFPVFQEEEAVSAPQAMKDSSFDHTSLNPFSKSSTKLFSKLNHSSAHAFSRTTQRVPNSDIIPRSDPRLTSTSGYRPWQSPPSRANLASPLSGENQTFDATNHTEWRNEIHNSSENLVIKSGGNLTLINSNLTLIGTQRPTNTSDYSIASANTSEEVAFLYYRWNPGQTVKIRVNWSTQTSENAVDARIFSVQDFPNSTMGAPDQPEDLPFLDLTGLGLVTNRGSPEETIFHVPADKGNLFFIAIFKYEEYEEVKGDVAVTDVQVPSL